MRKSGQNADRWTPFVSRWRWRYVIPMYIQLWEGAIGERVLVPDITPDWNSPEAQAGYSMHSGSMLAGWKFSNFKDGVFSEFFHVNDADGNLAHLPEILIR